MSCRSKDRAAGTTTGEASGIFGGLEDPAQVEPWCLKEKKAENPAIPLRDGPGSRAGG